MKKDYEEAVDHFETLERFRNWLNVDQEHDEFFFLEMQNALGQKIQALLADRKQKTLREAVLS